MVERFHRQLNSAIRAYPDVNSWIDFLPLILLGIHTSVKDEIGYSPAELIYGTTLTLPGQMIAPVIPQDIPDPTTYVHRLRAHMSQLSPKPPRPQETDTYVPTDINQWTHVFVRNDGIPARICPPYSGPYKVLQKREKYFVVDVNDLQAITQEFKTGCPWKLFYADDLALIAESLSELEEKFQVWKQGLELKGLREST
uniref:Reverse transcriptase domain-containing protein n=1 Tax=Octopus bimaculoides TaxID=37653 RepID=A0A0L8GEF2_OCTBM